MCWCTKFAAAMRVHAYPRHAPGAAAPGDNLVLKLAGDVNACVTMQTVHRQAQQIFIGARSPKGMSASPNSDATLADCTGRGVPYRISGSDVSLFLESPFSLYCKHFVDRSEKDPPDASQMLFTEHGHSHETRIMRAMYPDEAAPRTGQAPPPGETTRRETTRREPPRSRRPRRWLSPQEHAARLDRARTGEFAKTLAMMREGVPTLLEPQLCFFPRGMHGSPDILERRDGESFLGGHHYVVKEIKSSKRIRRKHIMQAAFYNVMLAHIQGRLPEQFYLLNADGEAAEYDHARYAREIEDVVAGVARIMEGNVPQVWYGGGIFPWSDYSDKVAIQSDDLSLISGMDRNTRQMLKEMGIGTVDALLEAGAGALKKAGVPSADAAVYTTRAGAIKSGNPVRRGPTHTIRRAETDVFLRVEEAMSGEVYMIGALTRCGDTRRHNTFVSAGPDDEARILDGFLEAVGSLGRCATYYWGSGEAVISRLAKKHRDGMVPDMPMTDLQQLASSLVAFPTYRDKLKLVAEWMGFTWRDPDADWGRGVTAYRRYAADRNRSDCLTYITQYAEDNCAAVERVWDWLLEHRYVALE